MSFQIFVKAEATRSFISGFTTGKPTLHDAFITLSKTFSVKKIKYCNYTILEEQIIK